MTFQRSISTVSLLLAGISSVIGSGWLFGPLYAAQIAGPAALLSWLIGGFLMIIIAFTFAELGSAFPVAAGMIHFAQSSYGPLVSFLVGWMVWVSSVAVAPVETLALIQYASNYLPMLIQKVDNMRVLTHSGMVVAAFVMLIMCILNYYGALFFSRSNNLITAIKLIVPSATVIVLLVSHFSLANFTLSAGHGFMPDGWHGILAALPLGGVIYSFIGSNTVVQLAGETKNPSRSIPIALIGSMVFCAILYALLQIAFIGALDPGTVSAGWSNLHYTGDNGPFSGIMQALGLGWFVMLIYADAIISPFGTGYVFTASTARVSYGLSDIGFLPIGLKKLTKRGIPFRCLMLNYVVGLLLFLPFPAWQKLVSFIISCFIVSYIIGPIALVALRKIKPETHRPFRLPFPFAIGMIAFYICNLLIYWTGWQTVYRMMIALLIGVIFFAGYCYRHRVAIWKSQWQTSWWIVPYFVGMTVISYLGTFGEGRNIISFGNDFWAIALLTVIIFVLAIRSAAHIRDNMIMTY
ncbi:MAG: amino acid permease [Gammaproteobacteria bacterium RIFCSPHIGHO2_12_FULL_42_10]|nr:MAG: amino acid permease [Gammaproteobacteria bacterium RIFCSPHIGHO2_12_FULL_42_10]